MDKETLSNYGWIVILVLILSVLLALATPFGNFIADGFKAAYMGLFDTSNNAMGIIIPGSGGGGGNEQQTPGIKFYQPYRYAETYDEERIIYDYVFHEDGSVDVYDCVNLYGESIPAGTCTYDDEYVYVEGEPAFKIGPNGSYVEMDGEGTFTLVPTPIKYLQYGETYVNTQELTHIVFQADGSGTTSTGGGANILDIPVGSITYQERTFTAFDTVCAVYPDGTMVMIDGLVLEIGCPHKNTEIRGESETYTGDRYCIDCGKLLNKGEIPPCKHPNTELRGANEEYTGDTYCKDCGELIENGESLLIEFYIDKYTYGVSKRYALPGMTWEEWLNSKYAVGYQTSLMINNDYWDDKWLGEIEGLDKMMSLTFQQDDGTVSVWSDYLAYNERRNEERFWSDAVFCDDVIIEGYHYNAWPYK